MTFYFREIATLTYRGGDEWKDRFGRHRIDENEPPSLCPYFMIENYLDYQGENAIGKIDPNTLLYISKVDASLLNSLMTDYQRTINRSLTSN